MDLRQYEAAKFELAVILRAAERELPRDHPAMSTIRELFARLAEDRFNLAVVGRFNRGKTSLMNAMMATERLPTGVVPLTSVITTVAYGSSETVTIDYHGNRLPSRVGLERLAEFITQRGNPGNSRGVRAARVQLPAEILRQGFHFVDTPGLGSSIAENTRTTEAFVPDADALMVVTSYDSPLSEEELRLLQNVAPSARKVFLVVNKHDMVSPVERDEVLGYIRHQLATTFGAASPPVFSVSASQALNARKVGDHDQWSASGVSALMEQLRDFLVDKKQAEFLRVMDERIAELLRDLPNSPGQAKRLSSLEHWALASSHKAEQSKPSEVALVVASAGPPLFAGCEICQRIDKALYDFLCKFQYALVSRDDTRQDFANHGGMCDFHTWWYQSVASPRGTCIGYPEVLDVVSGKLRELVGRPDGASLADAIDDLRPKADQCEICRLHDEVERKAVADLARRLGGRQGEEYSPVCLHHFRLLMASVDDRSTADRLLSAEAGALERLSADMRRYVLRVDGTRRFLLTREEETADLRALMVLAGHRNVTGAARKT